MYLLPVIPFVLLLLVQGCSAPTRPASPPPVVEQGATTAPAAPPQTFIPDRVQPPPQRPPVATTSPPVVALLGQAEDAANAGNLEAAAASLERAIRIEPRNPLLWYHLATVRLAQQEPVQAEQLAAKSNSLAAGNPVQQARNWKLIASARQAQGDSNGAQAAARRARELAGRY